MVKRSTRNYKEKKHFITFGQFILPLAVIMALALLFFSVKLFFLPPSDIQVIASDHAPQPQTDIVEEPEPQVVEVIAPGHTPKPQTDVVEEPEPQSAEPEPAKPVVPEKTTEPANQPQQTAGQKAAATRHTPKPQTDVIKEPEPHAAEPEPAEPVAHEKTTEQTNQATRPAPEAQKKTGVRWDIQIGGFASHDGAKSISNKARAEGYDVYTTTSQLNDAPFFKVRVRGSESKESAQKIARKLESAGYPVYLIAVR